MATKGQIQKIKDEKICQLEAQGAESIIQALKEDGLNLNANLTPGKVFLTFTLGSGREVELRVSYDSLITGHDNIRKLIKDLDR